MKSPRIGRVALVAAVLMTALFGIYLTYLYQHLEKNFTQQEEFIPTRIYSDVTRIYPGLPKAWVDAKLKALGYSIKTSGSTLSFNLHALDYPSFLLPDGHPEI